MRSMLATEEDGIEVLYRGRDLHDIQFTDDIVKQYNRSAVDLGLPKIPLTVEYSKDFIIPDEYKTLDVEEYIIMRCPEHGYQRVVDELAEFRARNLYPIIQLLIYIVDTMRKNNAVWGVGRGSSVASYCLYLIGVHKIDSLKYDLDINEFLK